MIIILISSILFSSICIQERKLDEQIENQVLHLCMNLENGKELILSDDSRWAVSPEDQEISRMWLGPFALEVRLASSKEYSHILTNLNSGKKIRVKPVLVKKPAEDS